MKDASEIRCLGCGYILKGLAEHRCPECSRPFDPRDPATYFIYFKTGVAHFLVSILPIACLIGITVWRLHARSIETILDEYGVLLILFVWFIESAVSITTLEALLARRKDVRCSPFYYLALGISLLFHLVLVLAILYFIISLFYFARH